MTINSLFNIEALPVTDISETNVSQHRAFYQQIAARIIKPVKNRQDILTATHRLVRIAENALDLQQTEVVDQIGRLLASAPLPAEFRGIGEYYQVFALRRRGAIAQACGRFERVIESEALPAVFRARAHQVLGVSHFDQGHLNEALYCWVQAAHIAAKAGDVLTQVNAQWMIALRKSLNGDHAAALNDFEQMTPVIRFLAPSRPYRYYDHANSLAVELAEVGRCEEALRLVKVALNSRYAHLNPAWRDTHAEILGKMRRSSPLCIAGVDLPRDDSNVVAMPIRPRTAAWSGEQIPNNRPAEVLAYAGWRPAPIAPAAATVSLTTEKLQSMSVAEKQTALLDVIYSDNVTHETLDRLLVAAQDPSPTSLVN